MYCILLGFRACVVPFSPRNEKLRSRGLPFAEGRNRLPKMAIGARRSIASRLPCSLKNHVLAAPAQFKNLGTNDAVIPASPQLPVITEVLL